jgi:hypothetical protein
MIDLNKLKSDYKRDGYVVIERFMPDGLLCELRAETNRMVAAAREGALVGRQFDVIDTSTGPELRRIKDPESTSGIYDRAMRWDPLIDLVAELLDGTVRFDHGKLNFKPPTGGGALDWHQDYPFYPNTNTDMLAVGIMIEDCTPENGPLMVVPGSHKGEVFDHHQDGVFVGGVASDAIGDLAKQAVTLTAPAGSISIHHTLTLHASTENRSTLSRPLLLYNYFATDAFPVFAARDWEAFNARILRGETVYTPRYDPATCKVPAPKPIAESANAAGSIFDVQRKLKDGAIMT